MEKEKIKKANELNEEISELENFLNKDKWVKNFFAEINFKIKIPSFLGYTHASYIPSQRLVIKIREIMKEHLKELEEELRRL